jgi:selenoprotein W-related protein
MVAKKDSAKVHTPRIEIHYCTQCRFILRASWLAQELLMTFAERIGELALVPSSSGVFAVLVDGEEVFSRKTHGRFPDSKELKQLIRDRIDPAMSLGHSDE